MILAKKITHNLGIYKLPMRGISGTQKHDFRSIHQNNTQKEMGLGATDEHKSQGKTAVKTFSTTVLQKSAVDQFSMANVKMDPFFTNIFREKNYQETDYLNTEKSKNLIDTLQKMKDQRKNEISSLPDSETDLNSIENTILNEINFEKACDRSDPLMIKTMIKICDIINTLDASNVTKEHKDPKAQSERNASKKKIFRYLMTQLSEQKEFDFTVLNTDQLLTFIKLFSSLNAKEFAEQQKQLIYAFIYREIDLLTHSAFLKLIKFVVRFGQANGVDIKMIIELKLKLKDVNLAAAQGMEPIKACIEKLAWMSQLTNTRQTDCVDLQNTMYQNYENIMFFKDTYNQNQIIDLFWFIRTRNPMAMSNLRKSVTWLKLGVGNLANITSYNLNMDKNFQVYQNNQNNSDKNPKVRTIRMSERAIYQRVNMFLKFETIFKEADKYSHCLLDYHKLPNFTFDKVDENLLNGFID